MTPIASRIRVVVIISSRFEWQAAKAILPPVEPQPSPYGEWFALDMDVAGCDEPVVFLHGGWGKIAAAASAQYAIDRWSPELLVNLGTCGGFEGEIERGVIILAERTIVYDIIDQMIPQAEALAHYTTAIDLAWLGEDYPQEVRRALLLSADRDILPEDIPRLKVDFGAVAADWESGAIAHVAARNGVRCLILRGVSDLVGSSGGEAYEGNLHVFVDGAAAIMRRLVDALPAWLARAL
jgi:adenosylhomocysteine nucleosidase